MELAAKRKSVFAWFLALLIVMGVFGENRAWGFFAQPQPAPGIFDTPSQASTEQNYDASRYDAPDYVVAANKGLGSNPFKGKSFEEIDQILRSRGFTTGGSILQQARGHTSIQKLVENTTLIRAACIVRGLSCLTSMFTEWRTE